MVLHAGDELGPYEILSPLGQGGMGQVWTARDPRLNRVVAALNHSHTCQIYGFGREYLVMELAGGLSVSPDGRTALYSQFDGWLWNQGPEK